MYTETADVAEPWWPPRIFSDVCSCLFTVCLNLACTHALSRACVCWYELGKYTSYTSKVHITYRDTLGNDRTVTWVIAIRYPIITKLPDHTQTVTLNFFVVVSDMACIGHTSQKCHAIRCLKKVMCLQSKDSLKMYAACSIHVCLYLVKYEHPFFNLAIQLWHLLWHPFVWWFLCQIIFLGFHYRGQV